MTPRPLTPREARFVEHYRLHGKAAQAAREAGYAGHQSGAIGWTMLRRPKVIAALRAHGIEIVLTPRKTSQFQTNVKTYRRKGLTLWQERFVAEYLIDGNGTQAAIRAGLPGNPSRAGTRMLHHRQVAAAIQRQRAAAAARLGISADRVKDELAAIGFATIGAIADWGPGGVVLKEKSQLSPHDRAAVAELSSETIGEDGGRVRIHVKMHSKQRALEALGKHLGLWGAGAKTIARLGGDGGQDAKARLRERLQRIMRGADGPAEEPAPDPAKKDGSGGL
jgi:phage terminase small subunit